MESFEFNAPRYYDFINDYHSIDDAEAYFDLNHEEQNGGIEEVVYHEDSEIYPLEELEVEDPLQCTISHRSHSTNDLTLINENASNVENGKFCIGGDNTFNSLKALKRRSNSLQSLRERSNKYISLAEAVTQFHIKTPERFHSKSSSAKVVLTKVSAPLIRTVPASPFLATKKRVRPISVLSQDERELKEFEELQKFKFKAYPINKKILSGPLKATPVLKKPLTELQPFNLTEVCRKKVAPVMPHIEFHAQPVPKFIKQKGKLLSTPMTKKPLTICHTPKVLQRSNPHFVKEEPEKKQPVKPIIIKPFTFLERDKDSYQKKQQALSEIVEQQKANREFHAKPLPKMYSSTEKSKQCFTKDILNSTKSVRESVSVHPSFKAKPAKVLFMDPFIPKKEKREIEVSEFQLSSEVRAKEREAFELKLKEKEEWINKFKKRIEDEKVQQELEEVAKIRKEVEHKAQPIRKYKAVKAVTPKPLTLPITPKFHRSKNKE